MPKRSRSGRSAAFRAAKRSRRARSSVRRRPRMNAKSMLRMARSAVLKTCETKYYTSSSENQQLYHNGGAANAYNWAGNMLGTVVSNNQGGRIGDEVWPVGLSLKLWLSNKADRPNVMYRILIVASPPDTYSMASPTGLFKGSIGNKMLDYVDTDRYTIKYSKLVQPFAGDYSLESGATNKEHSRMLNIWIPIKGKIQYAQDTGTLPKYQKHIWSLIVIAYDAFGSLTTDNIASFSLMYRFYFKDP